MLYFVLLFVYVVRYPQPSVPDSPPGSVIKIPISHICTITDVKRIQINVWFFAPVIVQFIAYWLGYWIVFLVFPFHNHIVIFQPLLLISWWYFKRVGMATTYFTSLVHHFCRSVLMETLFVDLMSCNGKACLCSCKVVVLIVILILWWCWSSLTVARCLVYFTVLCHLFAHCIVNTKCHVLRVYTSIIHFKLWQLTSFQSFVLILFLVQINYLNKKSCGTAIFVNYFCTVIHHCYWNFNSMLLEFQLSCY